MKLKTVRYLFLIKVNVNKLGRGFRVYGYCRSTIEDEELGSMKFRERKGRGSARRFCRWV